MLAYFFPPMGDGGVFRSLKLARYLPAHDWEPVVVCGRPEDYWVRDDSLLDQLPADLEVHRVGGLTGQSLLRRLAGLRRRRGGAPAAGRRSSRGFARLRALGDLLLVPDSYAGWIPAARRAARRRLARGDIDLIYSSGPPDSAHRAALDLARASGLPWVADFRDPWFNLHLKAPPTPLHRWLHRRQEAAVLARVRVVAVTEGWRRRYAERCPRPPVLIRNGFDPADFADLPAPAPPAPGAPLVILHAGKLSLTRSARPFLAGLARFLAARPAGARPVAVTFLGPRETDNEAAARELGLGDVVRFEDPVSHAESLARQRAADLLLLVKHDDARYRDLIPGKFYEYAAAGRPVLAVTPPSELEDLLAAHGLGWTARPRAANVAGILAEAEAALDAGWRPRPVPDDFTRPVQAARMAALFDELAGGQGRSGSEEDA